MVVSALERDPDGSFKDFGQRKSITAYDPYNFEAQYASIKYEDEVRMRASIVIDMQKSALDELN